MVPRFSLYMALARISELGVQKYTFGMNLVSNSRLFHPIALYTKIGILGCPKSAIRCSKDTWGPLHKTFTGEKTRVKSENSGTHEFTIDFTIGSKIIMQWAPGHPSG